MVRTKIGLLLAFAACLSVTAAFAGALQPSKLLALQAELPPADAPARPEANPKPDSLLHLSFPLSGARIAALKAFVESQHDPKSPNYGHWLTQPEIGSRFGASQADISAVVAGLRSLGFTVTHVWANGMSVSAQATVAQVESAFKIHLLGYQCPARLKHDGDPDAFFAPDGAPRVPAALGSRVTMVLGLSTLPHMHSLSPKPKPLPQGPGPYAGPLGPADVSKVYNNDGLHALGLTGTGCVIGIYSPTTINLSDVQNFATNFGITAYSTSSVKQVQVDGGTTSYTDEVEACIDTEICIGQANNVQVNLYEGPSATTAEVGDVFNQMGTDGMPVVAVSYGFNEAGHGASAINALDGYLVPLVAGGMTIFASSGDAGSADGANWPASSVYVTAVGGTSLPTQNNGFWDSETAWNDADGASTGGLSTVFSQPAWQAGPGVSVSGTSNGMRQVPDVAALASTTTPGYLIFAGGGQVQAGGTSCSSPLWAISTRLILQGAEKLGWVPGSGSVGFGNLDPAWYYLGTNLNPQLGEFFVFHDITSGNNGGFSCTPFWDFVTGWGSVDFTKLYDDLLSGQAPGTPSIVLPNLHPTTPSAQLEGTWTSPIMIHASSGSVTEPSSFTAGTSYQIAVAIANDGPPDTINCNTAIQIDGGSSTMFTLGAIPGGGFHYSYAATTMTFTAGTHTLKLIADVDGKIKESNENDNTYSRTITVVAPPNYTVTPSAGAHGTISPSTAQSVSSGGSVTFTATPSANYVVSEWQVDGANAQAGGSSYTLSNVTANHTVSVTFAIQTFTITPSAGSGGTVSPSTAQTVGFGGSITFTASPSTGYVVSEWQLDGNNVQAGGSTYKVSGVAANHTVNVTFVLQTFTITPSESGHGTISPSTAQTVSYGASLAFTATPSANYQVNEWQVDGANVQTGGTTYTLSNVKAAHTVSVTFGVQTFTVTASAGAHGSVSPSGAQTVNDGGGITFTATPIANYTVGEWQLDGQNAQAGGNTYRVASITANHTVSVSFVVQSFKVTPSASTGGTISPNTTQLVNYGSSITFTASPSTGYVVSTWLLDGQTVQTGGNSYRLTTIAAAHNVKVNFALQTFTVTPSAGSNGTISPATAQSVSYGGSIKFTATPAAGYSVNVWQVDGTTVQTGGTTYTLSNVTAKHTVTVSFH